MPTLVEFSPTQNRGRPNTIQSVGSIPSTQASGSGGSSVNTSGITVEEFGVGQLRQTVFTFTNTPLTIPDDGGTSISYAALHIYDFPLGRINVIDFVSYITLTTTSALASTLNASSTVRYGFGTAAASSITLATTMMNLMPGSGESVKTRTSSATVSVASASATGFLAAVSAAHLGAIIDGTVTAADAFLNFSVPTTTDIDGNATTLVNGQAYMTWLNTGVIS